MTFSTKRRPLSSNFQRNRASGLTPALEYHSSSLSAEVVCEASSAVKVVGTATPKRPSEQWNALWEFSTGDELMIRWESSTSISSLNFYLKNETSSDTKVKLLAGRKLQYQKRNTGLKNREDDGNTITEEEIWPEEEGFVTLVRLSEDNPSGKATALLNWKLLVVEFSPEEDAVFVLLLCIFAKVVSVSLYHYS